MRQVLFLTSWYPTNGTEVTGTFVREHAKAASRVADVRIVHIDRSRSSEARPAWADRVDRQVAEGVAVRRLTPIVRHPAILENLVVLSQLLVTVVQLRRKGFRPSLVHAHVYEAAFFGAFVAQILRIPLVVTEHSSVFGRQALGRLSLAKTRWTARRAHALLPVSEDLGRAMRASGLEAGYVVVPNAVDDRIFHYEDMAHDGQVVLFVGRLSPEKNLGNLLDAVEELVDVKLVIVGDGPMRAQIEKRATESGLNGRVTLLGEVGKDVVAGAMASSDVLVLPSEYENMPCVVLEALVSGLPVVCTRVGGLPEVVDDSNGRLVDPGDLPKLITAIEQVLAAKLDRAQIAERSIERFGLEAIASQLRDVYTRVSLR